MALKKPRGIQKSKSCVGEQIFLSHFVDKQNQDEIKTLEKLQEIIMPILCNLFKSLQELSLV
jgi:hypothetical protein